MEFPIHSSKAQIGGDGIRQVVSRVVSHVREAALEVRADPSLQSPSARRAALVLLGYVAGAVAIINALIWGGRRRA